MIIHSSGYLFFPWQVTWGISVELDYKMIEFCESIFGPENWDNPTNRNILWRSTDRGLQFKEYDDAVYFWLSWIELSNA